MNCILCTLKKKEFDVTRNEYKYKNLIDKNVGNDKFRLRYYSINPKGQTRLERHPATHTAFILEGEGIVQGGKRKVRVSLGDAIVIPSNELHQFKNTSDKPWVFLCATDYDSE